MRLGLGKEYLCLIPPPDEGNPSVEDQTPPPSHPSKTWSLLQPLTGKCLYVGDTVQPLRDRLLTYPLPT
jgi:protein OS-9